MHAQAHYAAWDSAPVADRYDDRPSVGDSRSIDDLDHAICTLARQMNAETYRMLMLVREFDERLGWQKWGLPSCAEWLAWRCGLSLSAAREKVRTAHALREMPAVAAAFEDGRLSYSKVRALTRVVEYGGEETLLAYALEVTAAQVDERCREIRNANPDDSTAGAFRAWEHRSLTVYRDRARGMMKITVDVPIGDGEVIAQAIERAAEVCDAANGLEFAAARKFAGVRDASEAAPNGWCAQQCDALLAIAKASLAGASARLAGAKDSLAGTNPSAEGSADQNASADSSGAIADAVAGGVADHYQVVIHVDGSALRGGAGRSELPIETVRRLACDGSTVTVLEDERGTPLDVGRKQRTVSTPLKRALWARDRGCRFPGCHRTRFVDVHHIHHWADGGETSLYNLVLLCTHHHRLLHEGGFAIRRDAQGELYFRRPDGRVIPRGGYRLEDRVDETAGAVDSDTDADARAEWSANPSAEGFCTDAVREARGVYLIN
jgi:hypothetical protein